MPKGIYTLQISNGVKIKLRQGIEDAEEILLAGQIGERVAFPVQWVAGLYLEAIADQRGLVVGAAFEDVIGVLGAEIDIYLWLGQIQYVGFGASLGDRAL